MTTQAKNKLLAYIVMAMLAIVAIVGTMHEQPKTANIMLPKAVPVFVAIEEPSYDKAEFECLRTNLYFEAGNQDKRGREAAALVVLTRMKTKHYPSTACEVVKAWAYNKKGNKVCQFSWYCDGKTDRPNLKNPLERKAWEGVTEVAEAAMEGRIKDFIGRPTHYHANYVNPDWANVPKRYVRVAVVGKHIFYHDIALKLKA